MKIAAVSLLALLVAAMSHAQQPVIIDGGEMLPSLVPLFISCDLQEEFLTPAIDARTLFWMETPVSRDGARMRAELNRQWKVSQVPLVLNSETAKRCEARPVVSGPIGAKLSEPVINARGHVGVGCANKMDATWRRPLTCPS